MSITKASAGLPERAERLKQREAIVDRGLHDAWAALAAIRDDGDYAETHGTFEDYCLDRWGLTRSRAYQLIDASNIAKNVSTNSRHPVSEFQIRPLRVLDREQQREAWDRAVETAPDGQPTAAHVKETVNEMFPRNEPKPEPWTKSEQARKKTVESGHAVVANMKTDLRLIAWAQENGLFVRVDRTTVWGNPFILPDDGEREEVIEAYQIYLGYKPSLSRRYDELRGKVLGCWCYPEECHGNVLAREAHEECASDEAERVGCHK